MLFSFTSYALMFTNHFSASPSVGFGWETGVVASGAGVGAKTGAGVGAKTGAGDGAASAGFFSGVSIFFGFSGEPEEHFWAGVWATLEPACPFSASSDPGFSSCKGSPCFAAGEIVDESAVTDVSNGSMVQIGQREKERKEKKDFSH